MSDDRRYSERLRAQYKRAIRRQRQDELSKSMSNGNVEVSKRLTGGQDDFTLVRSSADVKSR